MGIYHIENTEIFIIMRYRIIARVKFERIGHDEISYNSALRSCVNRSSKMSEELDDLTFDLDNLYEGVAGNSENPIDTSEPEEVEDVGCVGGACTL